MNQDYQFYSPPVTKNAKFYRKRAWEALRGKFVMTAVSSFLFNLLQVGAMLIAMVPMLIVLFATAFATSGEELSSGATVLIVLTVFLLMFGAIIFLIAPLTVGYYRIHLDVVDGKPVDIGKLFSGFKRGYGKAVLTYFLYFLVSIATVIPLFVILFGGSFVSVMLEIENTDVILGVSACIGMAVMLVMIFWLVYRYSMVFFLLAEYPEMGAVDAMRNSADLMRGNKWRLFCLQFSFIGWFLLLMLVSFVSCGIGATVGTYLINAYQVTALASFYDDITQRAARKSETASADPTMYRPDDYFPGSGGQGMSGF